MDQEYLLEKRNFIVSVANKKKDLNIVELINKSTFDSEMTYYLLIVFLLQVESLGEELGKDSEHYIMFKYFVFAFYNYIQANIKADKEISKLEGNIACSLTK